jgi:UDP-N-acetylglucosamine--N-acetylmuramyl-(pentapeptide) pyrophosphoryl-undecaprenol N-acetylglucosamine transferase
MGRNKKIIISGGGTGGHIFPALSIANELKRRDPQTEILFVGALGRMEMEKIPAAGYNVIGLPVRGFKRKITPTNLFVVLDAVKSMFKAGKILKSFNPDIAVGVGGYASGPLLKVAERRGIPTLLQEQNSYAGVTNRMLSKKAKSICVAYEGMEKYFPKEKIVITGNPIRKELTDLKDKKTEALKHFQLSGSKKILLIVGGSLGAATINLSMIDYLDEIKQNNEVEIIWQTGKVYYEKAIGQFSKSNPENVKVYDFINRMDLAYAIADVIISRAGAGTISELAVVGKPVILVPSPNVAEDHQTKNAMALVSKNAALMIRDNEAGKKLFPEAILLLQDEKRKGILSENIKQMAIPNSAELIVDEIYKILEKSEF